MSAAYFVGKDGVLVNLNNVTGIIRRRLKNREEFTEFHFTGGNEIIEVPMSMDEVIKSVNQPGEYSE